MLKTMREFWIQTGAEVVLSAPETSELLSANLNAAGEVVVWYTCPTHFKGQYVPFTIQCLGSQEPLDADYNYLGSVVVKEGSYLLDYHVFYRKETQDAS